MSYTGRKEVSHGILWSGIENFSTQGIQFVISIVLARLVMPEEYGLIAMTSIFISIAQTFIDSGFVQALIQKNNRTETDFSTVFFFNIIVSVSVYLILHLCSPYIADFYNEPQIEYVIDWIGLSVILSSFSLVQRAKLSIEMNFKAQAKASFFSVFISGVMGIIMAYNGMGVWALVGQALARTGLYSILLFIERKWIPILTFSIRSFKSLFSFGSKLLIAALLQNIYINLYSLVIGKFYNTADVGYFNRGNSLATVCSMTIMTISSKVMYPAQCKIQNDKEQLLKNFTNYLKCSSLIIFPIMAICAALSYPVIEVLLTSKWLPCAPLFAIVSIAYMLYPIMIVNNQILNVKGRSDLFLKAEIIKKILALAILSITINFGLIWLCIGILIYNIFDCIIIVYYAKKVIDISFRYEIKELTPYLLNSILCGLLSYLCTMFFSSALIQVVVGTIVGILAYVLLCNVLRLKEFKLIESIVYNKLKRK